MKKILFLIALSCLVSINITRAQCTEIPKLIDGEYHGCGHTIALNDIASKAEYIFEGRVLSDSIFRLIQYPGMVFFLDRVLVLKEFKGKYKSDTIDVINSIVPVNDESRYTNIGDEAIFLLSRGGDINGKANYVPIYGEGWGFIRVCGKKDMMKDAYEPLAKIVGHPYIDVHPNTCATQQKPKK